MCRAEPYVYDRAGEQCREVRLPYGNGILAIGRGVTGTLKIRISNNVVGAPLGGVRPGIRVDAGNASSVDDSVCVQISGNQGGGSGGSAGIGIRKQGANATVNDFGIEGLSPSPSTCGQAGSNFVSCSTAP